MEDFFEMRGKTALVTGAGRNLGRAIALEFAQAGADVIITVRSNLDEARSVAKEIESFGVRAGVVVGEAVDPDTVRRIDELATEEFGGVDIYVSNAAKRLHKSFFDTTNDEWFEYLNQQLTASWFLAKTFAPQMRDKGWGRIIHMNGPDGWTGGWDRVPHSTAKGGLRTLTKSLATGLGPFGITVNDIEPGFADTIRDPNTHPQVTGEFTSKLVERIPLGRQPLPSEVAWAALFLCSPRSASITGTVLHVDGGHEMIG